jgi:hypothetical protein
MAPACGHGGEVSAQTCPAAWSGRGHGGFAARGHPRTTAVWLSGYRGRQIGSAGGRRPLPGVYITGMVTVTVIGQNRRAAAHRAWYRQTGADLVPASRSAGAHLPAAALYDLCAEPDEREQALRALLRQRRTAVLLAGRVAGSAAAAARLVSVARRQRCSAVVTGGARFVPAFARLRELVCGGILGVVRDVRVQIRAAPAFAPEALPAGMDVGLWLAGDGMPVAGTTTAAGTSFVAGAAQVTVASQVERGQDGTAWQIDIRAELGRASASAVFPPGLPGKPCGEQSVTVDLGGRQRRLEVPPADPAGNELAAIFARLAGGRPWLALCTAERAARLLAVLEAGTGKVVAAPFAAG